MNKPIRNCVLLIAIACASMAGLAHALSDDIPRKQPSVRMVPAPENSDPRVIHFVEMPLADGATVAGTVLLSQSLATLDAAPLRVRVLAVELRILRDGSNLATVAQIQPTDESGDMAFETSVGTVSRNASVANGVSTKHGYKIAVRPAKGLMWSQVRTPGDLVIQCDPE